VEEEILYAAPEIERQTARAICGAMMFEGDEALKKVAVLSGGEKSRVMLGRLLVTPVNLLLLDEPTNHLDMQACDALLAALDSFDGAVVMVTHNEMFLHALAERLVVFGDQGVALFEGRYASFLERGGWGDETAEERGLAPPALRANRKELRRLRSEIVAQRSRVLKPLESGIAAREKEIERREGELAELNRAMQAAAQAQDGPGIAALARRIHAAREAVEGLFAELERLSEDFDRRRADFDQRLAQCDAAAGEAPLTPPPAAARG
jgi:ATP-binding cassette subfamily F protein 3